MDTFVSLWDILWDIHDFTGDVERKKETKKERKTPEAKEKWKMRVASGGIRTHGTVQHTCISVRIHVRKNILELVLL